MEYRTLKDIAKITMGQSPDSSSYNKEKDGLPFFQGNADFGELYPNERIWCNEPKKVAMPGDILISVRAPIGALNYSKEKSCIGRGLAAITIKNVVERNYIFHLLRARNKYLNSKGTGSTFKAIGKNVIEEVPVPQISGEEQQKCVNVIDLIESIIIERKSQIDKLDELVRARFVELFGDPLNNTKGWGEQRLGECCVINPKKNIDSRLEEDLVISFIPMASVSENGEILKLEDRFYRDVKNGFTYFCEGDVLFAKITPCMENGKGAVAVGLKNSIGFGSTEFHVLRPIKEKSNSYWLYVLTSFDFFRKKAEENMTGSAGQKRVQASFLENIKISVPPITLQIEFEQFDHQVNKSKLLAASQPQIHIYKTLTLL